MNFVFKVIVVRSAIFQADTNVYNGHARAFRKFMSGFKFRAMGFRNAFDSSPNRLI